jgi:hypothetical protein
MRPTPWLRAEPYRVQVPGYESRYGDDYGVFLIPYQVPVLITRRVPNSVKLVNLRCLASSGEMSEIELGEEYAWDHVSVSLPDRCPTWDEMVFIKDMFFAQDETVLQFHPPAAQYVNRHPYTLHLWRPLLAVVPLPPEIMV